MKKDKRKIAITVLLIVAALTIIAAYIYDIIFNKTAYFENLFITLSIVFLMLGNIARVWSRGRRKSLDFYEKSYKKELGTAFQDKALARKKLLCVTRLYNEGNAEKALKYLTELYREAETPRDVKPILLFSALCYTDLGLLEDAIHTYYEILQLDPRDSRTHSNLGLLLMDIGDYDTALKHFDEAAACDPYNYYAYNNRGSCYFRMVEYDKAIDDFEKALSIKNNGAEAAGTLTIIYSIIGDEAKKQKYFNLSVASGKNPKELAEAIEYFTPQSEED